MTPIRTYLIFAVGNFSLPSAVTPSRFYPQNLWQVPLIHPTYGSATNDEKQGFMPQLEQQVNTDELTAIDLSKTALSEGLAKLMAVLKTLAQGAGHHLSDAADSTEKMVLTAAQAVNCLYEHHDPDFVASVSFTKEGKEAAISSASAAVGIHRKPLSWLKKGQ